MTNYQLSDIDFLRYIKSYINKVKSTEKQNVQVILDINPDLTENFGKKILVQANTDLFEIALNNIIENANKHAFIDSTQKYKLEFRLSLQIGATFKTTKDAKIGRYQSYLKIEIANNGTPFSANFTLDKFIRKNTFAGKTGNTGIGGYDINEIVKYHNNGTSTLDLITTDYSSEFVTTYVILLPIYLAS